MWIAFAVVSFWAGVNWMWWMLGTQKFGSGVLWGNLTFIPALSMLGASVYCVTRALY